MFQNLLSLSSVSLFTLILRDSGSGDCSLDIGFCVCDFVLKGEEEVEQVPAETLYQGLLPSLPQYMVSTLSGTSLSG